MRTIALAACLAMLAGFGAGAAQAHDAPSGWTYPPGCCNRQDCRPVPATHVRETRAGWQIVPTGELVPFTDERIKNSPDGLFHWCNAGGSATGRTRCLYVPPSGM